MAVMPRRSRFFRELSRTDEMARATLWWADAEAASGFPERAIEIATEALESCPPDLRVFHYQRHGRMVRLAGR